MYEAVCFSGSRRLGIGYVTQPIGLSPLVQFIHDLSQGPEIAKTRDGTENAAGILNPERKGNADRR